MPEDYHYMFGVKLSNPQPRQGKAGLGLSMKNTCMIEIVSHSDETEKN